MRHLVSAAAAVAACAVLVGGAAVATNGVVGPRSDPWGHSPEAGRVPLATNTAPQPTFSPDPAASTYVPIHPCRVVNTAAQGGPIKKGRARSFHFRGTTGFPGQGGKAGGCGIPATATAVAATITTLHQSGRGSLKVWPAGASGQPALAASFAKMAQNSTGATLTLGSEGQAKDVTVQATRARTDVIVDVTGYYDIQDHLVILADGTVWYGNSHITELVHTAGTGSYTLVFPRSLAGCNVLTSSNDQRDVQVVGSWGGTAVTVFTSHESGGVFTQTDESFQVFVVC